MKNIVKGFPALSPITRQLGFAASILTSVFVVCAAPASAWAYNFDDGEIVSLGNIILPDATVVEDAAIEFRDSIPILGRIITETTGRRVFIRNTLSHNVEFTYNDFGDVSIRINWFNYERLDEAISQVFRGTICHTDDKFTWTQPAFGGWVVTDLTLGESSCAAVFNDWQCSPQDFPRPEETKQLANSTRVCTTELVTNSGSSTCDGDRDVEDCNSVPTARGTIRVMMVGGEILFFLDNREITTFATLDPDRSTRESAFYVIETGGGLVVHIAIRRVVPAATGRAVIERAEIISTSSEACARSDDGRRAREFCEPGEVDTYSFSTQAHECTLGNLTSQMYADSRFDCNNDSNLAQCLMNLPDAPESDYCTLPGLTWVDGVCWADFPGYPEEGTYSSPFPELEPEPEPEPESPTGPRMDSLCTTEFCTRRAIVCYFAGCPGYN